MTGVLLGEALAAYRAGLCVLPPRQDGSKRPIGESWRQWQAEPPSLEHIRGWYGARSRFTGLGTVCGKVSGNLELFEFDERWAYDEYKRTAAELGLGELVERIEAGYLEESPSGGIHWLMRCEEIAGNTVLAQRPKKPEEKRRALWDLARTFDLTPDAIP